MNATIDKGNKIKLTIELMTPDGDNKEEIRIFDEVEFNNYPTYVIIEAVLNPMMEQLYKE